MDSALIMIEHTAFWQNITAVKGKVICIMIRTFIYLPWSKYNFTIIIISALLSFANAPCDNDIMIWITYLED